MYIEELDNTCAYIDYFAEAFAKLVEALEDANGFGDLYEQLAEIEKEAAKIASDSKIRYGIIRHIVAPVHKIRTHTVFRRIIPP